MTARRCQGNNKAGRPCGSPPLRGGDFCLAHDEVSRDSVRFGGPQPGSGRPRVPRSTALQRELVERHAVAVVRPYVRALGLDIDEDGNVTQLARGAIVVGRDKEGGVHASTIEDLGAQIAAAEALLNRVHGKPRQALEHTGADGGPIELDAPDSGLDLRKLSNEQLELLQDLVTRATPDR
jgi:hypothetical protein